jgi:hypothetical protein
MSVYRIHEGLSIFMKYDQWADCDATHEYLMVLIPKEKVSEDDQKRLEELSWHYGDDGGAHRADCWHIYV